MKVELDGKEFKVLGITLETILNAAKSAQDKYMTATVILQKAQDEPITLFSKSVFTKNATIEDIIKDTWEDNQN